MPVPIQLLYNHVGRSPQTNEDSRWTLQFPNGQSIYLEVELNAKTVDIKPIKLLINKGIII